MVYKQVSAGVIIRKVMRDLKPAGDNWVSDAIEWTGEALEAIGSGSQIEPDLKILNVKNHTAIIPSNLYYINMLAVDPLFRETNKIADYTEPLSYATSSFPRQLHCDNSINATSNSSYNYVIQGNYFKTSFEKGCLALGYHRIATDNIGWPLVPDDFSFKQAIYWYIFVKMMEGGMSHPHLNYQMASQQWLHYAGQARDEAKMPDIPRMENFMQQWVRLIPERDEFETMFEYLKDGENLDRDYNTKGPWGNHPVSSDILYDPE